LQFSFKIRGLNKFLACNRRTYRMGGLTDKGPKRESKEFMVSAKAGE